MIIRQLKINDMHEPIGFDLGKVRVSWKVDETDSVRPTAQTLKVSLKEDMSDPILVMTDEAGSTSQGLSSIGTELPLELTPRTRYFVEVAVTGDAGDSAKAETFFETGRMGEAGSAKWIAAPKSYEGHPEFVRAFVAGKDIARARLYISSAGLFEARLNGEKIGHEFLTPYINQYESGLQIITFPIEDLKEGQENTLTVALGPGWYMSTYGNGLTKNNFGDRMALNAELIISYKDGHEESISTDSLWQFRECCTVDSGIYDGEIIDMTRFDGRENPLRNVEQIMDPASDPGTLCLAQPLQDRYSLPVIIKESLPVAELIHTPAGETVLDFGQNFAGFPEFSAKLPKGTHIKLEVGEILQQGNFYHKNYRAAVSELHFTSDGEFHTVQPRFTFFGFRYVKVTGWPGEVDKDAFVGRVLYSDMDRTGEIETGNAKINRLYQNTLWSMRSNFLDIPTDCPQRSERLGWTGDAQIFAPTATYHMDTKAFFRKFFRDLRDEQLRIGGIIPSTLPNFNHTPAGGAIWGDVATFVPWSLYHYYGDEQELKTCYPMMKDWVDWIDKSDAELGRGSAEEGGRKYIWDFTFTFGDWVALDGSTPMSYKGGTDDGYLATMYYFRSTQIVSEAAAVLGYADDAAAYAQRAEKIRQAIYQEYFTPSGRLAIDTQAAYVVALKFGVYPDRQRILDQFMTRMKKDLYSIKCGFVGAPQLCTVLAEQGLTDMAYDFLFNEEFPGWLYEVNLGATTIWERWNSVGPDGTIADNEMNSLNHYAYGSVMEFVYGYAVGIRPAEPGYRKAILAPRPDARLGYIKGSYDSVAGRYACGWTIHPDGKLTVEASVPFGCEAELTLPEDPEGRVLSLGPGEYRYEYMPARDLLALYGWDTRVNTLVKDPRAMDVLHKYLPGLAELAKDPERGSMTFREISRAPFIPAGRDLSVLDTVVKELERIRAI